MEHILMVRSPTEPKEVRNIIRYLSRLFKAGKKFTVKVSEPGPKTTFFEKLGGLQPGWEEDNVLVQEKAV